MYSESAVAVSEPLLLLYQDPSKHYSPLKFDYAEKLHFGRDKVQSTQKVDK